MSDDDITYVKIDQQDPRLGRNILFDRRSRAFPLAASIDRSTWRDRSLRVYDPYPNPNQTIGNCTGCSKATQMNTMGSRKKGQVLNMADATRIYSRNTEIDPWPGVWPPDDTGSSTLAAAKTAQEFGIGTEYRWIFGGADEIVQTIVDGRAVVLGTYWEYDMFRQDSSNRIRPGGGDAGGHAWTVRGYWKANDWVLGRCWWGGFRDFWISRMDLDYLMRRDGDAHVQDRVV
jgi:hypothetical protein